MSNRFSFGTASGASIGSFGFSPGFVIGGSLPPVGGSVGVPPSGRFTFLFFHLLGGNISFGGHPTYHHLASATSSPQRKPL